MNNEEMFLTILNRMDRLETDINEEFYAVREEMDMVYNSLNNEIRQMNDKIDKLMFTKDVEGYDKIDARFKVLEQGYRDLKAKIG